MYPIELGKEYFQVPKVLDVFFLSLYSSLVFKKKLIYILVRLNYNTYCNCILVGLNKNKKICIYLSQLITSVKRT